MTICLACDGTGDICEHSQRSPDPECDEDCIMECPECSGKGEVE